jgi:hypothetical protein
MNNLISRRKINNENTCLIQNMLDPWNYRAIKQSWILTYTAVETAEIVQQLPNPSKMCQHLSSSNLQIRQLGRHRQCQSAVNIIIYSYLSIKCMGAMLNQHNYTHRWHTVGLSTAASPPSLSKTRTFIIQS